MKLIKSLSNFHENDLPKFHICKKKVFQEIMGFVEKFSVFGEMIEISVN